MAEILYPFRNKEEKYKLDQWEEIKNLDISKIQRFYLQVVYEDASQYQDWGFASDYDVAYFIKQLENQWIKRTLKTEGNDVTDA